MRDASWDSGEAVRQGGRKPWLKWLLLTGGVTLSLSLVIGGSLGSLAFRHRSQLWPAVRNIHSRLQSDEGARELFKKNPALAETYAHEQDFVATVRDWRAKVGGLPVQEPAESPTYSPNADPGEVSASIKGSGGAWMMVEIQGGALAGPIEGEGINHIFFGADEKALESAREKAGEHGAERAWEEFREVMLRCNDDLKAAELYRVEFGLHATYPSETAFLDSVRKLRPVIANLPATNQKGLHEFSIHSYQTPFANNRVLSFRSTDGQRLVATWKGGQLNNVELRPAHNHA